MEKLNLEELQKNDPKRHVAQVIKLNPRVQIMLSAIKPDSMTPSDTIEAILRYLFDNNLIVVKEGFDVTNP